ncbi:MAG: hypothetical protein NTW38_00585 [Candidatus Aminicenantes bacterium]|nr:hypothetical protein [Candidatus Aminicenantes bacterium]
MKIINIFHYLSHARWIFFIWAMFLIFTEYFNPSPHFLSNVGLAIFLMGLFLGFWGFSDIEKLSKREKKEFANPKGMKGIRIIRIFILIVAGYVFIQGIYFMNIKSIHPSIKENIAVEFKTVGYHCFALGFGFLCYLKLMFDKYKYYKSLPEDKQTCGSKE